MVVTEILEQPVYILFFVYQRLILNKIFDIKSIKTVLSFGIQLQNYCHYNTRVDLYLEKITAINFKKYQFWV